ncbi:MAG: alkylated DNA repair dioxygenase AlkB [Candidatus Marivariicella framensis]|jgi:alkylated DNA repair dioxygenase AlkB|tara:strand:+ start:192 stop:800 length:609 start_codon:yes stop_codon:yes gene_type:complete
MSKPLINSQNIWNPNIPDGELVYYPNFLNLNKADELFIKLKNTIPWQQDPIKVFGKTYLQPRLTSLHSINKNEYSYSNITMESKPMTAELIYLKNQISNILINDFNTVLLNHYRDGKDSNGWHADNEKELGVNPVIGSVSLGQERVFHLKHKKNKTDRFKIMLQHGSLLIMSGSMQHNWLHQIPKTSRVINDRINLTFRKIT